jgi:phage baseplate assembly protein gpV
MRLHDDQFIGGHFCWFTGIVEDIQDPDGLDRVRVRAIGYHSDDKGEVPTASLPLATVMGSTLNAGHKGVGSNHQLVIGSWVIGFFRDGASAQDPVIMGTIASSQPDGTLDMPQEAQADPNNNKVYRSEGGHVVEFDNTLNASRIKVTHNKGTSILIDKDGNVTIDASSGGGVEEGGTVIDLIGNTKITGKLHVTKEITSDEDIIADNDSTKISLENHTHEYVPGSGNPVQTEKPKDA